MKSALASRHPQQDRRQWPSGVAAHQRGRPNFSMLSRHTTASAGERSGAGAG